MHLPCLWILGLVLIYTSSAATTAGSSSIGTGGSAHMSSSTLSLSEEFEVAARLDDKENPSDKVSTHGYQEMYGTFLLPLLHHRNRRIRATRQDNKPFKMLEIGLGCDMKYGPGKSMAIWKRLLDPSDIMWAAEVDTKCVTKHKNDLRWLQGIVTGDQADKTILNQWINDTKATTVPFDVIIDDGGHENHQIYTSFMELFPKALGPGGLYFIEDLHVNRLDDWKDANNNDIIMIDVIKDWQEQLITREHANLKYYKHIIPHGIKWITCFPHACVIAKCSMSTKQSQMTTNISGLKLQEFAEPLCS